MLGSRSGLYVDSVASTKQTPCPSGESTILPYSGKSDCYPDFDFDKIPDSVDEDLDGDSNQFNGQIPDQMNGQIMIRMEKATIQILTTTMMVGLMWKKRGKEQTPCQVLTNQSMALRLLFLEPK